LDRLTASLAPTHFSATIWGNFVSEKRELAQPARGYQIETRLMLGHNRAKREGRA